MTGKIIDLESHRPEEKGWLVSEVMCLCGERWIAVYHHKVFLKELECKICGPGKVFITGEKNS